MVFALKMIRVDGRQVRESLDEARLALSQQLLVLRNGYTVIRYSLLLLRYMFEISNEHTPLSPTTGQRVKVLKSGSMLGRLRLTSSVSWTPVPLSVN